MTELSVIPIERVDMRVAPQTWRFAVERRAEIDAHFAELKREKPAVWNGRVLISCPAPATPMMTLTPHPLWQHSSAWRMTCTLPMHSKL